MTPMRKALLLAALHVLMVAGLGGKFLYDRATRPRFWLRAVPVDPDTPIRGRYVSLRVEVPVQGAELPPEKKPVAGDVFLRGQWEHSIAVVLTSEEKLLVAKALPSGQAFRPESWPGRVFAILPESLRGTDPATWTVRLREPLAFFIPEHVPDPSRREKGEELWVEVTLPKRGPLRPIRLGVKKDGRLEALER